MRSQSSEKPLVELIPYRKGKQPKTPGGWKDKVVMSNYFDDEFSADILQSFTGEND